MKKIKLKISGLHCKSCKTMIETEIDILSGVKKAQIDYQKGLGEFEFDENIINEEKIKNKIIDLGYSLENDESSKGNKNNYLKMIFGIIFLSLIIAGYFAVTYFGGFEMLARLNEGGVGYGLIFIIGLVAGFHCVGMCGCFVLAYSAKKRESGSQNKILPHLQYNLGRILSYTIIGGILGGLGSFFGINPFFSGIVLLLASIFMILMGLSFLINSTILEKLKLRTPQFIAKLLYNKNKKRSKGPLLIGLLNGFMPCGPLQAMQLYALMTGSMTQGALSMGIYAFGTAIMMFSFGLTVSAISAVNIKKMIKISGVLIIFLGILMANRGLANFGYGFTGISKANEIIGGNKQAYQEVKMDLTYTGYNPNTLYIKPGIPVRWIINVKQMTGCTDAIMIESLNIKKDLSIGENIIEFTPPEGVKEIKFSCWMRMVWGKFIITDNNNNTTNNNNTNTLNTSKNNVCGGSCGSATCGSSQGGGCGCGK